MVVGMILIHSQVAQTTGRENLRTNTTCQIRSFKMIMKECKVAKWEVLHLSMKIRLNGPLRIKVRTAEKHPL